MGTANGQQGGDRQCHPATNKPADGMKGGGESQRRPRRRRLPGRRGNEQKEIRFMPSRPLRNKI
jgi:hypothetical protein